MNNALFMQLKDEGLLSDAELEMVIQSEAARTESLHWDLRFLLYSGIVMLSSGLGVLVYKNLNSIGHITLLGALCLLCLGSFAYCFKFSRPFSWCKVESPNIWFDYVLLLGSLLMVTFLGYLQFQFHPFGNEWGLATFIPMLLLYATAYYFDHNGVLSMAIASLAAWMGIALQPTHLLHLDSMNNDNMIWNGVVLGLLLHLATFITETKQLKMHFAPVYKNFGIHVLFIALLVGSFTCFKMLILWCLAIGVVAAFHLNKSVKNKSIYYFVVSALYLYVAVSYVFVQGILLLDQYLSLGGDYGQFYIISLYFIGSGVGVVSILMNYSRKLKQ